MSLTRKPRAILYDDDVAILGVLEKVFSIRGYEVFSFAEPNVCPVYSESQDYCRNLHPCSDIMMTDYHMPGLTGLELLENQARKGCKLDISNKALMSGNLDDDTLRAAEKLGCAIIMKPFTVPELSLWLDACEKRFDLSKPVGIKRKETRRQAGEKIVCYCDIHGKTLEGTILNMSDSGLCLQAREPMADNQTVTIDGTPGNCCRSAEVKWTRKIATDLFMTGLNCR